MSIKCRFVYEFKNTKNDQTRKVSITGCKSKFESYQKARDRLINKLSTDIREFESNWVINNTEIAMGLSKNLDIDNRKIRDEINKYDGVKSIKKLDTNEYSEHILYAIQTQPNINEDYIIDEIREYFNSINELNQDVTKILFLINPKYLSFQE